MEKCKFCDAELEEGVTLCPSCGKDNLEEAAPSEEPVAEETAAMEPVEEAVAVEPAEEAAAEETAEEISEEVSAEEAPAEIKEEKKATPGKIALAVIAIVVLIAMIVGLLAGGMGSKASDVPADTAEILETEPTTPPTTPPDGNPDDETCKGTYTVSDEAAIAAAKTVVATMGDKELTNGELQVYYWNYVQNYISSEYGYQSMMYGLLNTSQGLDTQISMADQSLTWQQYFLKCAIQNWQNIQALALEAEAAGYTIDEEAQQTLDAIPDQLQQIVEQYELENAEEFLALNWGAGVTLAELTNYQKTYYEAIPYYEDEVAKFAFTEEEIEAFFAEHEEEYAQLGLAREDKVVDVRHCLIMPEGAATETIRYETFPEEAWAAAEKEANELLENWKKGDKSEESFAEMANEYTDDGNDSNADGIKDGGLYTGVTKGQMVAEFENWCFDETRQSGDVGIVKTEFGYHIMYFVKGEAMWPSYAEQDLIAITESEFMMSAMEKHPVDVDYSAIQLAAITIN